MEHQLLHGARGAVLGRPHRQLGVMGQEQVGQIIGILGVILGAAGSLGHMEAKKPICGVLTKPPIDCPKTDSRPLYIAFVYALRFLQQKWVNHCQSRKRKNLVFTSKAKGNET
jgi:hypothetical protein